MLFADFAAAKARSFSSKATDAIPINARSHAEHMPPASMDWFGKDVPVVPVENDCFETTVSVQVSPQFFGWLFGLGSDCEIVSPQVVREQYAAALSAAQQKNQ